MKYVLVLLALMASTASAQETFLGEIDYRINGPYTNIISATSGTLDLFMNFTEQPLNNVGPPAFSEEITADVQFLNSYTGVDLQDALDDLAATKSPYVGLEFIIPNLAGGGTQIPYDDFLSGNDTITRIDWEADVTNVVFADEITFDVVSTVSFYGIVPRTNISQPDGICVNGSGRVAKTNIAANEERDAMKYVLVWLALMATAASAQETFLGEIDYVFDGPRTNLGNATSGELNLFLNFTPQPLSNVGPAAFSEVITMDVQFLNSYTGSDLEPALEDLSETQSPYVGLEFTVPNRGSGGQRIPYDSFLTGAETITRIDWEADVSNVVFADEITYDVVSTVSFYGSFPSPHQPA